MYAIRSYYAEIIYSTENTIKLLNIDLAKSSVELNGVASGAEAINPVLSYQKAEIVTTPTPPVINPSDVVQWDESLFIRRGNHYNIKLDMTKIYHYNGKYYVFDTPRTFTVSTNTLIPTSSDFSGHVTEYIPK